MIQTYKPPSLLTLVFSRLNVCPTGSLSLSL
uniref:Uncharacterized protein n=1 Tax=Arundo donax TaxID=35708 RepID=A0A0A9CUW0_ARUDO